MVSPIIIAGPTASGKSHKALQLALEVDGEIICADSRQIYSHMAIGTAGPTADEVKAVPHHGFARVDPDCDYNAGQFIKDTDKYISEVIARGKTPILVGGTGLYLRSLRYGLSDVPPQDLAIRQQLVEQKNVRGLSYLYAKLVDVDPKAAQKIASNDELRIIRALEIVQLTGNKPSELRKSHGQKPRLSAQWILLFPSKDWLQKRIEIRVRLMFDQGLIKEAVNLRDHIKRKVFLLKTMGYEEALLCHDGIITKNEAISRTIIRHRQYAKRQMTWFKKEDWWQIESNYLD